METTYTPNAYSEPLTLPTVPPSVSLSPTRAGRGSGLQRWLNALSGPALPVPNYTPEALDISIARWEAKWDYFQKTFREDVEQSEFTTMSRHGLIEYVKRLENEFTRLRDRFVEMNANKASAEVSCGIQLVLSLIEEQIPQILRLKAAEMDSISEPLQVLKQEAKVVDRVYKFALQSSNAIHSMKVQEILSLRRANASTDDPEMGPSADSRANLNSNPASEPSVHESIAESSHARPTVTFDEKSPSGPANGNGFTYPPQGPSQAIPTTRAPGPPSRQASRAPPPPPAPAADPAVTQAMSSAASHRANLLTLSAISFFGAGMAWSTIFSGTRGDIVLISWAACCFLVGAVSAVSATSLVDADGTLIERFQTVRWTVRLLSLCSVFHAFVGVMLVSAAILALDPNASSPGAGISGGNFTVLVGRVAGGYSLVVCGAVVVIAFIIRGRYTRRTWFV